MRVALGLTFIAMLAIILVGMAQANSVGVTVNQIVEDVGWGAVANLSGEVSGLETELDIQAQGGDLIRGRYHAEVGLGAFRLFQDGTFKGYSIDGLGRQSDLGLKGEVAVAGLNVGVGVFGRNAGEFGAPNAYDQLVGLGHDEGKLEGLGLESITPAPTGLSIKGGNSVNLLLFTELEVGDVDVELKLMPEIAGEGEPVHQALISGQTDYQLSESVKLNLGIDLGLQSFDDVIEYETATLLTLGVVF